MTTKKRKWIQKGIKRPGRVKAAAKKAGRSVSEEARVMARSSDPSERGAGKLAMRFKGMSKHGNIRHEKRKKSRSKGR